MMTEHLRGIYSQDSDPKLSRGFSQSRTFVVTDTCEAGAFEPVLGDLRMIVPVLDHRIDDRSRWFHQSKCSAT